MKKKILFLIALVFLFGTKVSAASYINRIDINYDTTAARLTPAYTYNTVRGKFSSAWVIPNEANYSKGNDNIWFRYCESLEPCELNQTTQGYGQQILNRYTYVIFEVFANQFGMDRENPEYDFDPEHLDEIEIYVNGVKRDDAIARDYNSSWREVDVAVPVPVDTNPFVSKVKVLTDYVNVEVGKTAIFTAVVESYGDGYDEVTWTINDKTSENTTIDEDGVLTVGADEELDTITVRATSKIDANVYGEKSINVSKEVLTIDGIVLTPMAVNVIKGKSQTFKATVTGSAVHTVNWTVNGNNSEDTVISNNGKLTVAADETAAHLTVTVTSTYDESKSVSASVDIIEHSDYIDKIEFNYDTNKAYLSTSLTYNEARNLFKNNWSMPDGVNYSTGNNNIWMRYCPTEEKCDFDETTHGYQETILNRYTYVVFEVFADPVGNEVENPEHDFDKDHLDEIEIWVNGVKREDAFILGYNSSWREVDVVVPVEVIDSGNEEPEVITIRSIDVTGVVAPVEGEHPETANVRITTPGITLKSVTWLEDKQDGKELTSSDTFVSDHDAKYMLRLIFDLQGNYEIENPEISSSARAAMDDFVGCPPEVPCVSDLDLRLYYGVKSKEPVGITATPDVNITNDNNKALKINIAYDQNATRIEVYRSTSSKGTYTKIATITEGLYKDEALTYGTTYYYKVRACNEVNCSPYSNVVSGKIMPEKAEGLEALEVGTNQVKLGWTKQAGMTGYEISRSTKLKGKYTVVTTTKDVDNYLNKKLSANTTYYYRMRAYKLSGKTKVFGPYSDVVEVKTAPVAPKITASVTDYNKVTVAVKSVKGATKYAIYRSTSKTGEYTKVGEINAAGNYVDSSVTTGVAYYYKVQACNTSCGNYSSVVSKTPVPKTPSISLSVNEAKKVKVAITEVAGATGYEIERSLYKSRKYAVVGTTETLEYTDEVGLNTKYYYRVRAYRVVEGKKVYGGYSSAKYTKVTLGTPSITVSKNGFEEAKVTIKGVTGAAGYEIYRSIYKTKKFTVVKDTTELENVDEIKLNTTNYYKVRAYIVANGKKYYSKYTSVKSIKLTLGTPTLGLERTGVNKVSVKITEVENAEGYEIYRSLYKNKKFTLVKDTEELTYEDTVNLNTNYYYKVRAYIVREGKKYYSNYTALKTTKLGLGIPTYTLEGQSAQVEVRINEVEYAEGYEIYRATAKYGKYTKVGETTEGVYNDPAQPNKTFYYKIRAYVTNSEKRVYSAYSIVKSAKALALVLPE